MCRTMVVTGQQHVKKNKEHSEGNVSCGEMLIMKVEGRTLVVRCRNAQKQEGMLLLYLGSDILETKLYAYTYMPQGTLYSLEKNVHCYKTLANFILFSLYFISDNIK